MHERTRFERELSDLGFREYESPSTAPAAALSADSIDEDAAQCIFPATVRDRIEPLLPARAVKAASKWNGKNHPGVSGIGGAVLQTRLERYVNRTAIEQAMRNDPELKDLAGDAGAVLAAIAHQFQQKIYSASGRHDGKLGEGTLDALGFVHHKGKSLNSVDQSNHTFHAGNDTKAYKRLKQVFRTDPAAFRSSSPDLKPQTWYFHFVNPPFLGWPIGSGIHLELVRRLRLAEKALYALPQYAAMSPVQLGAALGFDENHGGGRLKNTASMHTFGLAIDIGYLKNPWVAGQADSPNRNAAFRAASRNVSKLMEGVDEELTPAWLDQLGTNAGVTTGAAFDEVKRRHTNLVNYLALGTNAAALRAAVDARSQNPIVVGARESVDRAVRRWARQIRKDSTRIAQAFDSKRRPQNGFLNLHRDLVVALRDRACLAWGGIDLGASQSGDMMHFDCRASGLGRVVLPPSGHPVTSGHPCVSTAGSVPERETPRPKYPQYSMPQWWTFKSATLPLEVGLFIPSILFKAKRMELLLFLHGHNVCSPVEKDPPITYITSKPFRLGSIVETSGRPMAIVVPDLDWFKLAKNKMGSDCRPKWHKIGAPENMNGVLAEAVNEILQHLDKTLPVTRLVIAGHSRAYDVLDPLAAAHASSEMGKGALKRLSHIWAFDTTYSCPPVWDSWLMSGKAPQISVYFRDSGGTQHNGRVFKCLEAGSKGKLSVTVVKESHCAVPVVRLPQLLKTLP